jgi:hypothetical protein
LEIHEGESQSARYAEGNAFLFRCEASAGVCQNTFARILCGRIEAVQVSKLKPVKTLPALLCALLMASFLADHSPAFGQDGSSREGFVYPERQDRILEIDLKTRANGGEIVLLRTDLVTLSNLIEKQSVQAAQEYFLLSNSKLRLLKTIRTWKEIEPLVKKKIKYDKGKIDALFLENRHLLNEKAALKKTTVRDRKTL